MRIFTVAANQQCGITATTASAGDKMKDATHICSKYEAGLIFIAHSMQQPEAKENEDPAHTIIRTCDEIQN